MQHLFYSNIHLFLYTPSSPYVRLEGGGEVQEWMDIIIMWKTAETAIKNVREESGVPHLFW